MDNGDSNIHHNYLGVNIQRNEKDGTFELTQPKLIKSILNDMNYQPNTKPTSHPAKILEVLDKAADDNPHRADWNYRSIIGKLNYLEKSTRPDLAFATHNAARFSSAQLPSIRYVGTYLGLKKRDWFFHLQRNPLSKFTLMPLLLEIGNEAQPLMILQPLTLEEDMWSCLLDAHWHGDPNYKLKLL